MSFQYQCSSCGRSVIVDTQSFNNTCDPLTQDQTIDQSNASNPIPLESSPKDESETYQRNKTLGLLRKHIATIKCLFLTDSLLDIQHQSSNSTNKSLDIIPTFRLDTIIQSNHFSNDAQSSPSRPIDYSFASSSLLVTPLPTAASIVEAIETLKKFPEYVTKEREDVSLVAEPQQSVGSAVDARQNAVLFCTACLSVLETQTTELCRDLQDEISVYQQVITQLCQQTSTLNAPDEISCDSKPIDNLSSNPIIDEVLPTAIIEPPEDLYIATLTSEIDRRKVCLE